MVVDGRMDGGDLARRLGCPGRDCHDEWGHRLDPLGRPRSYSAADRLFDPIRNSPTSSAATRASGSLARSPARSTAQEPMHHPSSLC